MKKTKTSSIAARAACRDGKVAFGCVALHPATSPSCIACHVRSTSGLSSSLLLLLSTSFTSNALRGERCAEMFAMSRGDLRGKLSAKVSRGGVLGADL